MKKARSALLLHSPHRMSARGNNRRMAASGLNARWHGRGGGGCTPEVRSVDCEFALRVLMFRMGSQRPLFDGWGEGVPWASLTG